MSFRRMATHPMCVAIALCLMRNMLPHIPTQFAKLVAAFTTKTTTTTTTNNTSNNDTDNDNNNDNGNSDNNNYSST